MAVSEGKINEIHTIKMPRTEAQVEEKPKKKSSSWWIRSMAPMMREVAREEGEEGWERSDNYAQKFQEDIKKMAERIWTPVTKKVADQDAYIKQFREDVKKIRERMKGGKK